LALIGFIGGLVYWGTRTDFSTVSRSFTDYDSKPTVRVKNTLKKTAKTVKETSTKTVKETAQKSKPKKKGKRKK